MAQESPEALVIRLATATPWRRQALAAVAELGLPDGWIGAGFVRGPVWDHLHGFPAASPLADIDVVYFDPATADDPAADEALEGRLRRRMADLPWSVRNQARMHRRNGDRPYRSTADALCHWLETPTAVALRQGDGGQPELLAPFGLSDLLDLILRPTPHARRHRLAAFHDRVAEKGWLATWPKITERSA